MKISINFKDDSLKVVFKTQFKETFDDTRLSTVKAKSKSVSCFYNDADIKATLVQSIGNYNYSFLCNFLLREVNEKDERRFILVCKNY